MKDYVVKVPIAGFIEISIRCENESQAIGLGLEKAKLIVEEFTIAKQFIPIVSEFEISAYDTISRGSFFIAPLNEVKTEDI